MLTASAFLSVLLAAGSTPPLRVQITSPKTRVSIFEPVKVTVRATANSPVAVPSVVDTTGFPLLETWIDYGQGFVQYIDYDGDMREGVEGVRRSLAAGHHFVETIVLVNGPMDRPTVPFPNPGRYSLRVVVRTPEHVFLGESNTTTFEVVAADDEDQRLVQRIRTQPWLLRAVGGVDDAQYASLAAEFPRSPYLHWGRRAIALEKQHRIGNGRYPDTDEVFDEAAKGLPLAKTLFRELATELLDADTWGQFDEERLQLAAENMERGGAYDEARSIWREIAERFPGSEAAEQAKSRLDSTPPSLQVAAFPSTLWPPNHRLEPITVSVQVSDDLDPDPRVKLVSISCDDGCVPAEDIAGATYDTDDRQFELRSERQGFGSGRTYMITYSATDASGNKTSTTTTVVVPHDQGKKK